MQHQRFPMLFKLLLQILMAFLLTLYALASLPPVLALALYSSHLFRRICSLVSSPIVLVFAALNASILLLSFRFAPIPSPDIQSTDQLPYQLNVSGLGDDINVLTAGRLVAAEFDDTCDNAAGNEEEEEEQVAATDEIKMAMTVPEFEHEADRNKCLRYTSSRSEIEDENCWEKVYRPGSETKPCAADVVVGMATADKIEEREVVEELSIAEFNRIIEAFLEKQKRFHCQENLTILSFD